MSMGSVERQNSAKVFSSVASRSCFKCSHIIGEEARPTISWSLGVGAGMYPMCPIRK